MEGSKYKPMIIISGLIVAALGGFYIYQSKFKKVEEKEAPEPEVKPETAPVVKPVATQPKPAPKAVPIGQPPRTNPGFVVPASGPQSVAVKTPKMGANLYVLSGSGANAYKTPIASQTNIYKFYPKGAFVGTFLSKSGSFSKLIVEETTLGIRTNKEVYVPSTAIYQK